MRTELDKVFDSVFEIASRMENSADKVRQFKAGFFKCQAINAKFRPDTRRSRAVLKGWVYSGTMREVTR